MTLATLATLATITTIHAGAAAGAFDLPWSSIDGGATACHGSAWSLAGGIGQPDAGTCAAGSWTLLGGFWPAGGGTPPPACPGDLDRSAAVDGADLGILLGEWGGPGTGDLNDDGLVDGADLGILLGAWGACVG